MKIAIIGGRNFENYDLLKFKLMPYRATITEVVSGGANGADKLGEVYAKSLQVPCTVYEAEWDNLEAVPCKIRTNSYGKEYNSLAGFNRNQKIIDRADFVVAFWDSKSSGTRDSIGRANKAKKDTLIVYY